MRRSSSALILAILCVLAGCLVGPNYKRPVVTPPAAYRDVEAVSKNANPGQSSIGDLKWADVFQDEQLKSLITEAIANNYDIRIAAQRVLEQQAQVGVTKSQELPSVSGGASYSAIGLPPGLVGNLSPSRFYGGGFTASAAWNLDFWGLYRRQTEGARAELLATEWGQRATMSSVVINVAAAYIQLPRWTRSCRLLTRRWRHDRSRCGW